MVSSSFARRTALLLLAAAACCSAPSIQFPRRHTNKKNGAMTPKTAPPNGAATRTFLGNVLDAAFDVLSTHAVSYYQLRSLLYPLLMPQQPAVPSKVIFIEG
jgi:flagellar basal body-associated protein FliL